MKIEVLNKDGNKINFIIEDINATIANTLRRIMSVEVPTLAIKEVTFNKNTSPLYDEIIAHRLGLLPLKTDLTSYNLEEECKCKGKGCALCQLQLTLKAKGPAMIYASDLKSMDPKVEPVYKEMPIVSLLKGQKLELEAVAVLGKGKHHTKFSPGLIFYRGYPELIVSNKSNLKKISEELNDVVKIKNNKIEINDLRKWNEKYEHILEMNNVEVKNSKSNFIFTIESWGQLKPKQIMITALDILDEKLNEFKKKLKKAK